MTHKITQESLSHFHRLVENRYSHLFNVLNSQIKADAKKNNLPAGELSDLVGKYGHLFGAIVESVEATFKTDSNLDLISRSMKDDFLVAYSANIASRVITKDLESVLQSTSSQSSQVLEDSTSFDPSVLMWGDTNYSTVRMALEGMVTYTLSSRKSPVESMMDFFANYSNLTNQTIASKIDNGAYLNIKDVTWEIGPYKVEKLENVVLAKNGTSTKPVAEREKGQFYTPLEPLVIDPIDILPRERIVGDQNIISYYERMVKCLFFYDMTVGKNPAIVKKKFQNKQLLEGMPGEGKGMVAHYIINYAQELSKTLGVELTVTQFEFESSFENGSIQKLRSQFRQVSEGDRLYLIFQDEIDQILAEKGIGKETRNRDTIKEFQKFLNGQYPNKGNYLLIAATNSYSSLPLALRERRFHIEHWAGAVTQDQKSALFRYKLESGTKAGYVGISDEEYSELGKLAFKHEMTGSDITSICDRETSNVFQWGSLGQVWNLKGNYAAQLAKFDELNDQINYSTIRSGIVSLAVNRAKAKEDSIKYEVA